MDRSVGRALLYAGLALVALAVPAGIAVVVSSADPAPPAVATGATPTGAAPTSRATVPRPTSPAPTTAGPASSRPGSANTGVPPGTALTVVTGDQRYSRDGQVISGLDIHGFVRITGHNITLKNSIVRGGAPTCNSAVIFVEDRGSATISDVEVAPAHPNACLDGVRAGNSTLRRLNIHGTVDGIKAFDRLTVLDSYVHDLSAFASDPNQNGGPTHNDAVQSYQGNAHILLRHNTFTVGSRANAALQVTQDGGLAATDLHIEDNWLDGGACTLNFSDKGGPTPMTGIYVVNNRFGRHSFYRCPILLSSQTRLSQNSGNVWDDTGAPIPAPQRHN